MDTRDTLSHCTRSPERSRARARRSEAQVIPSVNVISYLVSAGPQATRGDPFGPETRGIRTNGRARGAPATSHQTLFEPQTLRHEGEPVRHAAANCRDGPRRRGSPN